jgi:GT2 family glycosyltransferase
MKPEISFITGTRNRPNDLRRMIDSLEFCTLNWELIISDASDKPIENEEIATEDTWKRIKVIPERPRLGVSRGYNKAFRKARGRYCLWLNDDCVVEHGTAEAAVTFMDGNPHVGLGAIPYSEPGKLKYETYSYLGLPYANFGIISKELGDQIGYFDEEFHFYGSDNALAFRVLMAGKGIAPVYWGRIFHYATPDAHRFENNDPTQREHDCRLLISKYSPHLDAMRAVQQRICPGTVKLHDQTPSWAI